MAAIALAVVRLGPMLEAVGDELASDHGMSSAGWRVASAIGEDGATVPVIAARLGRRRQSVQVAVDTLVETGLAMLEPNPRNRRSARVVLSAKGREAFWKIAASQVEWAATSAGGYAVVDLEATARVLNQLAALLESNRA